MTALTSCVSSWQGCIVWEWRRDDSLRNTLSTTRVLGSGWVCSGLQRERSVQAKHVAG